MHRQILEACLPFVIVLIVAVGLLHLTIRLSRASWNWRRIKELHRCEDGGVQSLSLVLTLPFFVLLIWLIVQVSQLMIGMIGVHYAAYAGARAAVVWIPAATRDDYGVGEDPNEIYARPLNPYMPAVGEYQVVDSSALETSVKYRKVWSAAVLALTPFGPSTIPDSSDDGDSSSGDANYRREPPTGVHPFPREFSRVPTVAAEVLQQLVPTYEITPARQRIARKLSYVEQNTRVFLEWTHPVSSRGLLPAVGPTYNPWGVPAGHAAGPYDPNVVDWQDPVTVHVYHRFQLPGPGWILARIVKWTYPHRQRHFGVTAGGSDPLFRSSTEDEPGAIVIHASATMNNQGLIPLYGERLYEY